MKSRRTNTLSFVATVVGLLMVGAPGSRALADEAAGQGDPNSNMDYIDSDPDEGVMGNPSVLIEVDGYHGGDATCWICDEMGDYACSPYDAYPGWNWPTAVGFANPVPAGYIVTAIEATINGVACPIFQVPASQQIDVYINNVLVGSGIQDGDCLCGSCFPLTVVSPDYPCGFPDYRYTGMNRLELAVDGRACISDVHLHLVYDPIPLLECAAGGPYTAECQGTTTAVALDGTDSVDPCHDPLDYFWTTDCPGGSFDDNTSATPTLTVDSTAPCPLVCNVMLDVEYEDEFDSCSTTVTIEDTTAPTVTCPADAAVDCDESTDPAATGTATASDECDADPDVGHADVETAGACPQEKTITRTWTATDACGHEDSCDQFITVEDDDPPVLNLPADFQIECGGSTDPAVTGEATGTDNCDPDPAVGYTDQTAGVCPTVITRTWTATDACGNGDSGDQIITLDDTTDPVIACPANVEVECGQPTDPAATGSATATDNCDPAPAMSSADVTDLTGCDGTGTITRTWTATDECGNDAACVQVITVVDTAAPQLVVPADVAIDCDAPTDPASTGQATATDNCDANPGVGFADDVAPGSCADEYVITRTWTATDGCGNAASLDQTITVVDDDAPVLNMPADTTMECTEPTDPATTGEATAADNCDPDPDVAYADQSAPGDCPQESVITRTWTATDHCDNTSALDQVITVQDTTPPAMTCPGDTSVTLPGDTEPSATGTALAVDGCDSLPSVGYSDVEEFQQFCPTISMITRTWTGTDACGNAGTCDQVIEVTEPVPDGYCCDPANGTLTVIDDGDDCTDDICDQDTGQVTHPDNGLCHACCNITGPGTCQVVIESQCPGSAENFHVGEVCDVDSDGDGVADPCDLCPGVNDAIFAPGCVAAIPTASSWGIIVLALLLMTAAKVGFSNRRAPVKAF